MTFAAESHYTRHLPPGGDRVDAIISLTASDSEILSSTTQERVVGITVDKSGSMTSGAGPSGRMSRMEAVQEALERIIDRLEEDTIFFIVAFDVEGHVIFAPAKATPENKRAAKAQVRRIESNNGTAMSTGLEMSLGFFERFPNAIRQGLFLTDGKNESESPSMVRRVLERCAGVFDCDCWGLGTDWKVGEVQDVARALNGKASLLPGPSDVAVAFEGFAVKAQSKAIRDVRLRLWGPNGARFIQVRQMNPTIEDLANRGQQISTLVRDFPTGAWSPGEMRDYHVTITVQPGAVGAELLACRPSIIYLDPDGIEQEIKAPDARIIVEWSADDRLTSRINRTLANYTGQAEMATAIQQGLEAQEKGDLATATAHLGRAVKLAHETGNDDMTKRLQRVVDIDDPQSGTVRLKRNVSAASTMDLHLESSTTKRARRIAPTGGD
jgi:hypothetical protein